MAEGVLREFLNDLLPIIITRVLFVPDIQAYFQRIAEIEEGYARSLTFSDVYSSASNVIGSDPIFDLSGWLGEKRYPLLRDSVAIGRPKETADEHAPQVSPAEATREPPDQSRLKHSQRAVLSMIEPALWDAARWRGVAVLAYADYPPFLALVFENEEPARRIFTNWRKQLGTVDKDHLLRISILTGVDAANPSAYSLHISTNLEVALKGLEREKMAITMSRAKKMDSANENTMRDFHRLREQYGCYFLAPAVMQSDTTEPKLLPDVRILKRDVITRPAWEIGVNDPDISALREEDEPFIPDGIENPPVREALKWRRSKRRTG